MKLIVSSSILIFLLGMHALTQGKSFQEHLRLAEQGDANAQNEVGLKYSEGEGVKRNVRLAAAWFRKSAEQGNTFGACNLGLQYWQGRGVRKDKVAAMKWLYIANSLDSLKCHPGDYFDLIRPSKAEDKRAWGLAVGWLRARPDLKDDFGQRPWSEQGAQTNKALQPTAGQHER